MRIDEFEEQESLKNILWGTGVGTWEWNVQTGETRFNERWAEIVGYRLEELQPSTIDTWMSFAHPEDLQESEQKLNAHFQGEADYYECEARMRHKMGHWIWVLDRGRVVTWTEKGEPEWVAGTHLDITQRKQTEVALRESERLYRLAQTATGVGIWNWNLEKDQMFWDKHCWEMLNMQPTDQPISYKSWREQLHPDNLLRVEPEVQKQLKEGQGFVIEFRFLTANKTWVWLQGRGQVVERTSAGLPLRMMGTHTDIHQRKEAEINHQQQAEALRRSNEELEQFAYVASHDLRQPLRMVNSYLQMLERRLGSDLDADNKTMMDFARSGAQRLDQMLLSLLEYSRVGRKGQPKQQISLAASIEEALSFLYPEIQANGVEIIWSPNEWPQVFASPDEMTRLFQNLIGNAIKYHKVDETPLINLEVVNQGAFWEVVIKDQGIGIDPTQFSRLFQVFQRLHAQGEYEGTGIGLAIARKIVERHRGKIWVESEGEGHGSCFYFTLPKNREEVG
jgi:PAS domain S-box-containing protein